MHRSPKKRLFGFRRPYPVNILKFILLWALLIRLNCGIGGSHGIDTIALALSRYKEDSDEVFREVGDLVFFSKNENTAIYFVRGLWISRFACIWGMSHNYT